MLSDACTCTHVLHCTSLPRAGQVGQQNLHLGWYKVKKREKLRKEVFLGFRCWDIFCRTGGQWECFGDWQWKSRAAPEVGQQPKEAAGRKVFWDCVLWVPGEVHPQATFWDNQKRCDLFTVAEKGQIQLIAVAIMNFCMDLHTPSSYGLFFTL